MALIDDYSSDIFTSAFLPIGSTIKASLDYGHDEDWFKVTLQKGTTYLFSRPQDSAQDEIGQDGLFMELRDANGQVLMDSYGRGSMPIVQFTADRTGDYFLTARRAEIVQYIEKASYILWARIQAPDAIPSDISSTAVLPAGGSVYGQFEVAGDRDWYKFHAEGGKFYGWRSTAPAGSDSVFMDFEVYDGNGKLVDQYYPLEPAVSGDYFVSVQGLAGSYNFTSVERVDDYAINDQATTGTLLLEKTVKGAIQYISDEDSFKLSAKAGEYYQVVLRTCQEFCVPGSRFVVS